jgi:thiol-disulfide isomerase/thioredoxin
MRRRTIMSRNISKIIVFVSCALLFVSVFAKNIEGKSGEPTNGDNPELARMRTVLECTCECGLTLAYCEREDADCSVRPALLTKVERLLDEGKRGMELVRAYMGPMHPVKQEFMEARLQNRHAILFFYQEGSGECDEAREVLREGSEIWGDRVKISHVDINKKENDEIRKEFRVFSTPTILVMAPNGVVVREFKKNITTESLESTFVTPAMAQVLRGLQDKRVILLTVMAEDWKNASRVQNTVSSVGEILRNSVRIIHVDPTNKEEQPMLKILKVDNSQNQSLTYVVSQSGLIGSRFEGPVSRKDLFMAFQKVLATRSGCGGSGSGPGGTTCK